MYSHFKQWFLFIFLFFIASAKIYSQCAFTETSTVLGSVCSDEVTAAFNSGIIKIPIGAIGIGNTHSYSTVGETTGDTFLGLYDGSGNLLASNDDDSDCECKQSSLSYTNNTPVNIANPYIILSKPGCEAINFQVRIVYNVRNEYDAAPVVFSPSTLKDKCSGEIVQFTALNPGTGESWTSLTPDLISINSSNGEALILKGGFAKIELKRGSCTVRKTYLIKIPATSAITVN